jgi:hypothetical protein
LTALQHAAQTAAACHQNRWEFALELDHLLASAMGMATPPLPSTPYPLPSLLLTSLRHLRCQNLIEAAVETTPARAPRRRFRKLKSLTFPPRTCLVLSAAADPRLWQSDTTWEGDAPAEPCTHPPTNPKTALCNPQSATTPHSPFPAHPTPDSGRPTPDLPLPRPTWNPRSRTLTLDGQIIKRLRRPAACQVMILDAFDEEGWPESIYDPLPPRDGIDPKRRLHNAINKLNAGLARVIHFYGNGDGLAVCWTRNSRARCPDPDGDPAKLLRRPTRS